ncbi:MAG: DUF1841 family protein, partial [Gammaproteobacteria bacterium]|nr:DUF1841 family protein [Gammaproteobacteria bacterium]
GILENKDAGLDKDYLPEQGESNPFLHMSLHVALQEQLSTNRPAGVTGIFEKALQKGADLHQVEHRFIECISEMLWKAQRNNTTPNEKAYLKSLKKIR